MRGEVKCVLGLDLATHCGWNLWTPDLEVGGVWDLTPGRLDSTSMRLINLRAHLSKILKENKILRDGIVVWEEVTFVKHRLAYALHEQLASVVMTWCYDSLLDHTTHKIQPIKKYATGKGNANKTLMVAAAQKARPLRAFQDDNEADAFWVTELTKHKLALG